MHFGPSARYRTENIRWYNCVFDARGSAGGLFDTYWVRFTDLRYNTFLNFYYLVIRAMFVDRITMIGNTFILCQGHVVQIRYYTQVNLILNTFINSRRVRIFRALR